MIKNYFKIAWRHVTMHKMFSIINVLGLAMGLCACIVIYVITSFEFSFDTFHPGKDRIYRVMADARSGSGEVLHFGKLPLPVSQIARNELTGLDAIAGISPYNAKVTIAQPGDGPAKHFDSRTKETHFITTAIAEPQYFDIFKYNWLAGNASTALNAPFTVVLAESKARQYFGPGLLDKMIGRQVLYGDSLLVSVSGIVKDWNKNTDLAFTDFISFATVQSSSFLKNSLSPNLWSEHDMPTWTFAKLSNGTQPAQVNTQIQGLIKRHADPQTKLVLWLEPLSAIHFNADVIENTIRTAHSPTLYGLMGIALFILILAVINFINLSTAQSVQRAKEVGVRKVLGGNRTSLVFQFLAETFVLSVFAVVLAVLLVNPVLAAFQSFIPPGISFHLSDPATLVFLLLVTGLTSLLAGFYPARVLSAHLPVVSLKGSGMQKGTEKWYLRKGLIVFQFTVSLVFIIGSIVIASQLSYTRKKDLGFTSDAIVIVGTPWGDSLSKISVVAEKIKHLPGVSKVALQWVAPMEGNGRGHGIKFKSTDEKETGVVQVAGNEDYIPLYQIKLLAGRNLEHADSIKEIVINENLSRLMGCKKPEDAIGKMLYWDDKPYPVVGVAADFHSRSFHDPIAPLCIVNRPNREGTLAIKLATIEKESKNIKATLSNIEKAWKQVYPAAGFQYQFYDESMALIYEKDQRTATLMNTSMAITIFISCMGLFGLAIFSAERRTKEIGIRKVLGASVTNIAVMLSKDFLLLVLIALLIASPIAWYGMNQWLQDFAYRINISWWVFALAGSGAILIALITVGFQAIKAALANPVKSLRTE